MWMERIFAMSEPDSFLHSVSLRHQVHLNGTGSEAVVRPVLSLKLERAAVLFISQSIDGMEMFPPKRYPLDGGDNSFFLQTLRIVNPQPGEYEFSVEIEAAGISKSRVVENILIKN